MQDKTYIAIDLKSFYASVECMERGLDPLKANLVVADPSRTEKTICLAVSPTLKSYGISGRSRLFEVVSRVAEINATRAFHAPNRKLEGESIYPEELSKNPSLALSYIVAPPQMAKYIDISTKIYSIYSQFVSPEDMHVYSIDEVFIDATSYLKTYKLSARELAMKMILEVLNQTGITATAGIGSNMYLCKIAMDIEAKHIPADENGVRIAELDEMSYRRKMWDHRPITDFWRVGRGYAKKLEGHGIYTMGDIAQLSIENEDIFYKMFGINAELLIDHAWGWEPCTIADIKAYKPETNSLSSGQVLQSPYQHDKTRLVLNEMTEQLVYDLLEKHLVTDQLTVTIMYDRENLSDTTKIYTGEISTDFYGRAVPKSAHGSTRLKEHTSSNRIITQAVLDLFDKISDPNLLSRKIYVVANNIISEEKAKEQQKFVQTDLFTDNDEMEKKEKELQRERKRQEAILMMRNKYGKNAIVKGMNLKEGATAIERNGQIGGHKA